GAGAGAGASALAAYAARGVLAAYPEVAPGELFTAEGLRRWRLLEEVGGCSSAASQLFAAAVVEVVRPGWGEHWAVRAFVERVEYGGRELAAGGRPLLVMQGVEDPFVLAEWTGRAVGRTCAAFPGSSVEYATFEGVGHVPVMYAGQRVWLDWVADRFAGVPLGGGCRNSSYGSVRDVDSYLKDFNYFLEPVTSPYQVA
ncbi:Secretory lipase, partial [Neofusicoccum parvum]